MLRKNTDHSTVMIAMLLCLFDAYLLATGNLHSAWFDCRLQEIIDTIKGGTSIDQVMIETTAAPACAADSWGTDETLNSFIT